VSCQKQISISTTTAQKAHEGKIDAKSQLSFTPLCGFFAFVVDNSTIEKTHYYAICHKNNNFIKACYI